MVWLIIAIPGSAVIVGAVLLTLAIVTPESVVREDYYQAGRTINIDLRETDTAADLGVTAMFYGDAETGWLLEVHTRRPAPERDRALDVLLAHPTLAARDLEAELHPDGSGAWVGTLEPLEGRHMLSIRPQGGGWLLRREVDLDPTGTRPIEVAALPWRRAP